jgi:hypothetical protein
VAGIGESERPASAAAVAGLAAEVEQLRRTVERLRLVPGRLEQVAGVVTELAEAAAAARSGPAGAGAPSWLDAAGGDTVSALVLLGGLAEWMARIFLRYTDAARALPDCWLWHPDVVEELVWLRAAWLAAYRDEQAPLQLAADWHDRQRPGVIRRVRDLTARCSIEAHLPGGGAPAAAAGVPLADAAAAIAGWWTTGPDAGAPAPTGEQLAAVEARRRSGSRRNWG